MSLRDYIENDMKNPDIRKHFTKPDYLISALEDLDKMIGMKRIKIDVVNKLKTHVTQKIRGLYSKDERKHCLITGEPGLGKTRLSKILCRVWIGMGYISGKSDLKKKIVPSFNKLQDEIVRRQGIEIKEYKEKLKICSQCLGHISRLSSICQGCVRDLMLNRDKIPSHIYNNFYKDLNACVKILDQAISIITTMTTEKKNIYSGIGTDPSGGDGLMSSSSSGDENFHAYSKNDVVSRFVGDTSHRTTAAMEAALGGVAYFDEAYNLCIESTGMGDQYGKEALTVINDYMDKHADDLIVIFSGYKEDIYENLFSTQRGLASRFTQNYNIEPYDSDELTKIYILELKRMGWGIIETQELRNLFKENYSFFTSYGRDMNTLASQTKEVLSRDCYEKLIKGEKISDKVTDLNMVREALEIFKMNVVKMTKKMKRFFD